MEFSLKKIGDGILAKKRQKMEFSSKKIECGILTANTKTMPMCCSNIKQESGTAMCDHLDIAAEE